MFKFFCLETLSQLLKFLQLFGSEIQREDCPSWISTQWSLQQLFLSAINS